MLAARSIFWLTTMKKNISEWESCGGTGIHFKSAEETLKILDRIEKALK